MNECALFLLSVDVDVAVVFTSNRSFVLSLSIDSQHSTQRPQALLFHGPFREGIRIYDTGSRPVVGRGHKLRGRNEKHTAVPNETRRKE